MNSESVDLIATDPPFKKGRDFHATPDSLASGAKFQDRWSWEKDVHPEWLDQIKDDYPEVWEVIDAANAIYMKKTKKNLKKDRDKVGSDMGAFLCFMAVRLLEMHRILKSTGSIYLHCDPTASHYLKALLDSIFDKKNFRNEIIWKRATAKKGSTKKFGVVHDTILFYTKTKHYTFFPIYLDHDPNYIDKTYRYEDSIYGKYRVGDLTAAGSTKGSSSKPWRGISVPKGKHWACATSWPEPISKPDNWDNISTQDKLDYMDSVGLIYWPKKGNMPGFKRFLSTSDGSAMTGLIVDISQIEGQAKEKIGYPTQKPLELYGRFIRASSCKGDIVLDPFAGCATTCIVAEHYERQWVGIDIWDKAGEVVLDRLEREGLIDPEYKRQRDKPAQVPLFPKDICFTSELPLRTDDGEEAAPYLRPKIRIKEPEGPKMSRVEMIKYLLERDGMKCVGCNRTFDHPSFFELDHKTPRSDGGSNHISNRVLLCGPCNKRKSNIYTLSGLIKENKKSGFMKN